ncbi:hypothetical protein [Mycolicibacterium aichiense]|uniref:hypothetical protein n=1 Tax=Mycolicibacterium aichiense TaxID=1799 RepID=UPI0011C05781|nr:hypothetical protein [Mycolicibacterium aichiense]MCV7017855.1 hypothetical protein [Mycolicibacterium aichiense]
MALRHYGLHRLAAVAQREARPIQVYFDCLREDFEDTLAQLLGSVAKHVVELLRILTWVVLEVDADGRAEVRLFEVTSACRGSNQASE